MKIRCCRTACGGIVPKSTPTELRALPTLVQRRQQSTESLPPRSTVFSGIQPTGVPHLGNYLGALQQWVRLQDTAPADTKLLYSIVDLHALTQRVDPKSLRRWKKETLAVLLAIGLDPNRSILFYQSSVSAHAELMWILSCTASVGYLSRMTQWKTKAQIGEEDVSLTANAADSTTRKLGLFSYPVLQAADILVHGATHVPVGEDQRQHLEFARECATNFNARFKESSASHQILTPPDTILSKAKRVMSLREPHVKMSKSSPFEKSRILLTDHDVEISVKIRAATTDSISETISYNPDLRPGVSNLLELLSHFDAEERSPATLGTAYATLSMKALKDLVTDAVIKHLAPIRTRYEELIKDKSYLRQVAKKGGDAARDSAQQTMVLVREAIGIS